MDQSVPDKETREAVKRRFHGVPITVPPGMSDSSRAPSLSRSVTPVSQPYSETLPPSVNTADRTRSTTNEPPLSQQPATRPFPPPAISMAEHQRRRAGGGGGGSGSGSYTPFGFDFLRPVGGGGGGGSGRDGGGRGRDGGGGAGRRDVGVGTEREDLINTQYYRDMARDVYFNPEEDRKIRLQAGKFLYDEQTNKRNLQWGIYGALLGGGITLQYY